MAQLTILLQVERCAFYLFNKKLKNKNMLIDFVVTIVIILFNALFFIFGVLADWFDVLVYDQATNIYSINNSSLAIVVTSIMVEVLAIYHGASRNLFSEIINTADQQGQINEGVRKIEAHLINYDRNTIEFNYLSAIESEVGISTKKIRNEIWVISNDFEEASDTPEGEELINAIINNLKTNVDYYYIIPSHCEREMKILCSKLKKRLSSKRKTTTSSFGNFRYILDPALDFIPTSYFDIIMYHKLTRVERLPDEDDLSDSEDSSQQYYAERSSQIYYCFSRINESDEYFYCKVEERDIWERMVNYAHDYKQKSAEQFKDGLKN